MYITQSSLLSGLEKSVQGADAYCPNKHLFPPPAGWVDCPPPAPRGAGRPQRLFPGGEPLGRDPVACVVCVWCVWGVWCVWCVSWCEVLSAMNGTSVDGISINNEKL